MTTKQIKVMVVDDHPVVRAGYTRLLESAPDIHVVAEAGTGEEACALYPEHQPDVVVLDLNMPGMGGLETLRRLVNKDENARVLVFSMHDSTEMAARVLDAGAAGYLMKSSAAGQMVEAVHQVCHGKVFLSQEMASEMFMGGKGSSDPLGVLTEREFQIFKHLAEGMLVSEIADALFISPKTVGVHQTNIMKKLKLRNAAELSRLAIRCGVVIP